MSPSNRYLTSYRIPATEQLECRAMFAVHALGDLAIETTGWGAKDSSAATDDGHWFFTRELTRQHQQLWVTDGTEQGTRFVRDFAFTVGNRDNDAWGFKNGIHHLQVAGNSAFFLLQTETRLQATGSYELWTSDGTTRGTQNLGIVSRAEYAWLSTAVAGDHTMAFVSSQNSGDYEVAERLWITDGTLTGTSALPVTWPLTGNVAMLDGDAYFTGHYTEFSLGGQNQSWLYRLNLSDQTLDSVAQLPDNVMRIGDRQTRLRHQLTAVGGRLYFVSASGTIPELWTSDGTTGSTAKVANLAPDESPGPIADFPQPKLLGEYEGQLVFTSDGRDLWLSDGTTPGTSMTGSNIDFHPLNPDWDERPKLDIADNQLTLPSADEAFAQLASATTDLDARQTIVGPQSATFISGTQLRSLDIQDNSLTTIALMEGVAQVHELVQSGPDAFVTVSLDELSDFGSHLFMVSPDAAPALLESGTRYLITDLTPLHNVEGSAGGILYLKRQQYRTTKQLWIVNGSSVLPRQLVFGTFTHADATVDQLFESDGEFIFFEAKSQLWGLDSKLRASSLGSFSILALSASPGTAYFLAESSDGISVQLWRTDGTASGTELIHTLPNPQPSSGKVVPQIAIVGDTAFFTLQGRELWKSDGSSEGTQRITTFRGAGGITELKSFDGKLILVADDGIHGMELWTSDGSAAGTRLERDIMPGPAGSFPSDFADAVDELWFTANDGQHGRELQAFQADLMADMNGDRTVDFFDFLILSRNFGEETSGGRQAGDINFDGVVDDLDLFVLLREFGE